MKTIGCSSNEKELQKLVYLSKQEIERLSAQPDLFLSESYPAAIACRWYTRI